MAGASQIEKSFTKVADSYQKFRPGYPQELYDKLKQFTIPTVTTSVLDVGCGTGNVTRELAKIYSNVCGVEPSEGMLEQARSVPVESINPISWTNSFAEDLPYPNDSFDLITVAQAFHWFDAERFLIEAKRVLKPNGTIAIFAEGAASDEIFRSSIHKIIREYRQSEPASNTGNRNTSRKKPEELLEANGFREVQKIVIDYDLEWTHGTFIGFMNSMSMMADFDEAERSELNKKFAEKLTEITQGLNPFLEKNVTVLIVGKNP